MHLKWQQPTSNGTARHDTKAFGIGGARDMLLDAAAVASHHSIGGIGHLQCGRYPSGSTRRVPATDAHLALGRRLVVVARGDTSTYACRTSNVGSGNALRDRWDAVLLLRPRVLV